MRLATVTILPLLATAAVLPAENGRNSKDSTVPLTILPKPHSFEKRQTFWNAVGHSLQTNLPGVLRWAADNLTYLLRWQELPLKKVKLAPSIDKKAQRAVFRYGTWALSGAEVLQVIEYRQISG
jgi:hypothetical protein